MASEALGRLFNVVPTAAGVEVDMTDCEAVTFVLTGADTYTVQEAQDGTGTGAQDLAVIEHSYSNTSAAGAGTWSEVDELSSGDPVAAVSVSSGVKVITVHASQLSDGFSHVLVNVMGTGLVTALPHDLNVQRDPTNLPALTG